MCTEENQTVETLGLIDSGAGGKFIDQNFARQHKFKIQPLDKPIIVWNVDGTENKRGKITHFVDLKLNVYQKTMKIQLMVTGLEKQKIILGFPWLNENNPEIDWKTGQFMWRNELRRPLKIKRYHDTHHPLTNRPMQKPSVIEEPDKEKHLNQTQNPTSDDEILLAYAEEVQKPNELWINTKTSNAIEFHLQHDEKKEELPAEQIVPERVVPRTFVNNHLA